VRQELPTTHGFGLIIEGIFIAAFTRCAAEVARLVATRGHHAT
jgi:hypothetical protein